jgi:hypothetical protein
MRLVSDVGVGWRLAHIHDRVRLVIGDMLVRDSSHAASSFVGYPTIYIRPI